MNTERLKAALEDLKQEYDEQKLSSRLSKLQASLQAYVTTPNDTNATDFESKHKGLLSLLSAAPSNNASTTKREVFSTIGADQNIGVGLAERLSSISKENALPAAQLTTLTAIINENTEFQGKVNSLIENLDAVHISSEKLKPEECEIVVMIPRLLIHSDVEGLAKELHKLNRHLKVFKEVAGEDGGNLRFKSIGTTDPLFSFVCTPEFARIFAEVISWAARVCEKVLCLVKLKNEIALQVGEHRAKKHIEHMEADVEDIVKVEVEEETKDLKRKITVTASTKGPASRGRNNELEKPIADALRYILSSVDRGAIFEVGQGMPETKEAATEDATDGETADTKTTLAAQIETIKQVNLGGRALARLPKHSEPIFHLPPSPDVEPDTTGATKTTESGNQAKSSQLKE